MHPFFIFKEHTAVIIFKILLVNPRAIFVGSLINGTRVSTMKIVAALVMTLTVMYIEVLREKKFQLLLL